MIMIMTNSQSFLGSGFLKSSKLGEDFLPFRIIKGKRSLAQLWVAGAPQVGAATTAAFDVLISNMFPSKSLGGGPPIPCFRRIHLSLSGFFTNALYKCTNINPTIITNTKWATNFSENSISIPN
ncbi:hypothetical protein ACJIZ3_012393 [Penstemon smallii]|uniref:Uncharacterized protein n=1 Tax=Penstemon smallii TaxID=265156 RepID=A0ABD3UNG3_9LAMI